jgi:hypothetical protein
VSYGDWSVGSDEWPSGLEQSGAERFKWAWNEAQGELVWSVTGPGDGRPFHEEQVRQAWGREPSTAHGDTLGVATYIPAGARAGAHVSITAYFNYATPTSVVRWFGEAFPGAEVFDPAVR